MSAIVLGLGIGATPAYAQGHAGAHSHAVHAAMVRAAPAGAGPVRHGHGPAGGHARAGGRGRPSRVVVDTMTQSALPPVAPVAAAAPVVHVPPARSQKATAAPSTVSSGSPVRVARATGHGRSGKAAPTVARSSPSKAPTKAPAEAKGGVTVPGQAQKSSRQGARVAGTPALPSLFLITSGAAQPLQFNLAALSTPAVIPSGVPAAGRPVAVARPAATATPPRTTAPARQAHRRRGLEALLGVGGLSLQQESRLRVPIFFFLFLALFVAIQALIDRRDPKVLGAPERSMDDSVGFE